MKMSEVTLKNTQDILTTGKVKIDSTTDISGFVTSTSLNSQLSRLKEALNNVNQAYSMSILAIRSMENSDQILLQMINYATLSKSDSCTPENRQSLNLQFQELMTQLDINALSSWSGQQIFQYDNESLDIKGKSTIFDYTVFLNDYLAKDCNSFSQGSLNVTLNRHVVDPKLLSNYVGDYNLYYKGSTEKGIFTLFNDDHSFTIVVDHPPSNTTGSEIFTFPNGVELSFGPNIDLTVDQYYQNVIRFDSQISFSSEFIDDKMKVSFCDNKKAQNGSYDLEYVFYPAIHDQDFYGEFILTAPDQSIEVVKIPMKDAVNNSFAKVDFTQLGLSLSFFNANLSDNIKNNVGLIQASGIIHTDKISSTLKDQRDEAFHQDHFFPSIMQENTPPSGSYSIEYNINDITKEGIFTLIKPNGLEENVVIPKNKASISSSVSFEFPCGIKCDIYTADLSKNIKKNNNVIHVGDQKYDRVFQVGGDFKNELLKIPFSVLNSQTLGITSTDISTVGAASNCLESIKSARTLVSHTLMKFGIYHLSIETAIESIGTSMTEHKEADSKLSDADIAQELINHQSLQMIINVSNDVFGSAISSLDLFKDLASKVLR